jgi:hypothetical protein
MNTFDVALSTLSCVMSGETAKMANSNSGNERVISSVVSPLAVTVSIPGLEVRFNDVAEKIGRHVGGEKGAEIGRRIDNDTKDIELRIGL